jgi:hypothetical protein
MPLRSYTGINFIVNYIEYSWQLILYLLSNCAVLPIIISFTVQRSVILIILSDQKVENALHFALLQLPNAPITGNVGGYFKAGVAFKLETTLLPIRTTLKWV